MPDRLILLILGDSPTQTTGFARVVRNVLRQWQALGAFDEIHVWGIGYWGIPHEFTGLSLWPASQPADIAWDSPANLQRFAALLESLKPTHLWMLQDIWGLMPLSRVLHEATERGLTSVLYFPVDAPLEPCWTRILASVKHRVAYFIGKWMSQIAPAADAITVIPHGVDACFRPITPAEKAKARKELFGKAVGPDDFLMVNVSVNQRRKGLVQSLQVLQHLKPLAAASGRPAKLYCHCFTENTREGVHLGVIARQLGLAPGADVFFGDQFHKNGKPLLTDESMRQIYGMADLFLSTSLGEGWGLPVTEAMACGVPVAAPGHTSLAEILADGRGILLPLAQADVVPGDNNRLRARVYAALAACCIHESAILQIPGDKETGRQWDKETTGVSPSPHLPISPSPLHPCAERALSWVRRDCLTWPVIARQWLNLMHVKIKARQVLSS